MFLKRRLRIVAACGLAVVLSGLAPVLSGCAAGARMTVAQPGQKPPFDELSLSGKWAFFETSPQAERTLLAFAHPGAVDGRRQYFLYLQAPPEKGTHVFGPAEETSPDQADSPGADALGAGADPYSATDQALGARAEALDAAAGHPVRGFFLQSQGRLAGLTELVSGRLQVGGSPFDGGKLRLGRFELLCADGTRLTGRFTAKQNYLELRAFEEDLYPADVQALTSAGTSPPPTTPVEPQP